MSRLLALAVAIALLPAQAFAERYRVDLIVFLDKGGNSTELPRAFQPPDLANAIEPESAMQPGGAIEVLPESEFGLPALWQRLRVSRRYQPLLRLAWMQTDPTAERSLPLHVHAGPVLGAPPPFNAATPPGGAPLASAPAVQTVDGTIALRLSRYLFLDADLAYTVPQPDGNLASYRLKEVRKMKRDDLHYLDSPRLGIVARVTKAPVK